MFCFIVDIKINFMYFMCFYFKMVVRNWLCNNVVVINEEFFCLKL